MKMVQKYFMASWDLSLPTQVTKGPSDFEKIVIVLITSNSISFIGQGIIIISTYVTYYPNSTNIITVRQWNSIWSVVCICPKEFEGENEFRD